MNGNLRHAWIYTAADLWEPLAVYSAGPPDLFSDLYEAVDDYLAVATPKPQFEAIRNDQATAQDSFLALKGTDFASESGIVNFLDDAREVIGNYDIAGYEELYKRLLRDFFRKYNLRYRLDEPFKIRFLLPGSFTNLYVELQRLNSTDPHLASLLNDFEYAFDRYVRTQDPTDLKTCIAKASNYAEGLASATAGNPTTGNTLGALAGRLTDWPHDKVREALVNVYHFCCDYPGIRHGGTPASARRVLAPRDATFASLLLLCFTGYLSPQVDEQTVLGV